MFYLKSGASKVALHHLCTQMDFELIDVQIPTTLMENFGAYPMELADVFWIFCQSAFAQIIHKTLYEKKIDPPQHKPYILGIQQHSSGPRYRRNMV